MEKTAFMVPILVLAMCTVPVYSFYSTDGYVPVKEKITKIRVYLHDILSGDKPSAVEIARPNNTKKGEGPTPFGILLVVDDPLTDGPDPKKSRIVGNARGTYVSSSQEKKVLSLVLYLSLGFTEGEFKGSTLNVFSRNTVAEKFRELAIVGGTRKFRFARGFVNVSTVSVDFVTGDAVLLYDITVVHL